MSMVRTIMSATTAAGDDVGSGTGHREIGGEGVGASDICRPGTGLSSTTRFAHAELTCTPFPEEPL